MAKEFIEFLAFFYAQAFAKAAPKDTGELAKSFKSTARVEGDSMIFTLPDYWRPVEFGSPPHDIRPKDPKKGLYWKGAKHPMKIVHHPGNAPTFFIRGTIKTESSQIWKKALLAYQKQFK